MNYDEIVLATKNQCKRLAKTYRQDACELFSFCLTKIPGLVSRLDTTQPPKRQLSYINRSIAGYCLHYLRDHATLIRTPRGNPPIKVGELTQAANSVTTPVESLPDWVLTILEECPDTALVKRFANACLAALYPL